MSPLPSQILRTRLAQIGVPDSLQTRDQLWEFLARRWHIESPMPETLTADDLARTVINLLDPAHH